MNFYPRYIGDFARDTMSLSALQVGIYTLLLDHLYATEKPLPLKLADLRRIARVQNSSATRDLKSILETYFTKDANGYHCTRADEVIAEVKAKHSKAQKAAAARWGNKDASPEHMRMHDERTCLDDASQSQSQSKPKPKPKGTKPPQQSRTRTREKTAESAAAASPDDGDVLDKAKARTQVDALVAHLREEGVTDASAVHTAVRLWAVDPAVSRDVIDEAITRLRERHNVRHPMSLLARIVPDVIDEREHPPPLQVVNANGHGSHKLTPVQQREADARAVIAGVYGSARREGDEDFIDVQATEIGGERKLKNS